MGPGRGPAFRCRCRGTLLKWEEADDEFTERGVERNGSGEWSTSLEFSAALPSLSASLHAIFIAQVSYGHSLRLFELPADIKVSLFKWSTWGITL